MMRLGLQNKHDVSLIRGGLLKPYTIARAVARLHGNGHDRGIRGILELALLDDAVVEFLEGEVEVEQLLRRGVERGGVEKVAERVEREGVVRVGLGRGGDAASRIEVVAELGVGARDGLELALGLLAGVPRGVLVRVVAQARLLVRAADLVWRGGLRHGKELVRVRIGCHGERGGLGAVPMGRGGGL